MVAVHEAGVVLKLETILRVDQLADGISSAKECALHEDGWICALGRGAIVAVNVLEERFVHRVVTQDLGVAQLQALLRTRPVVGL